MEPANILLAQALTLIGLIGASGAYASLIRRRQESRVEHAAAVAASQSAAERVESTLFLGRVDHTFIRSAYLPHRRYPGKRRP
jgi:hypothetical protein